MTKGPFSEWQRETKKQPSQEGEGEEWRPIEEQPVAEDAEWQQLLKDQPAHDDEWQPLTTDPPAQPAEDQPPEGQMWPSLMEDPLSEGEEWRPLMKDQPAEGVASQLPRTDQSADAAAAWRPLPTDAFAGGGAGRQPPLMKEQSEEDIEWQRLIREQPIEDDEPGPSAKEVMTRILTSAGQICVFIGQQVAVAARQVAVAVGYVAAAVGHAMGHVASAVQRLGAGILAALISVGLWIGGIGWLRRRTVWVAAAIVLLLFPMSLWSTQQLIAALRRSSTRVAVVEEVPDSPYTGLTTDLFVSQGRLLRLDSDVDSVFIADPSIADVRVVAPDLIYVYGKKSGTTNLIATAAEQKPGTPSEDKVRASVRLRVLLDNAAPNDAVRELRPDSEVSLSIFGKRVIVTGKARNIDEAVDAANIAQTYSPPGQQPINNTTVEGSQQINIRVRFAEVSRSQLEALGVDWNVLVNGGNFLFGLMTGAGKGIGGGGAAAGSFSAGNFDINVFIEALQRSGVLTILAEPNLTALTGETATFLAGGEIPIPVPQDRDVVTVQYKQFGVALQFSPTIVKQNRISMRVKPEVSSISTAGAVKLNGFEMPAFTVRRAETTVDMASGQTFAIAGLFQRQLSRDVEKFPVLGDAPVLGALFRSERYRRNETELIILITPYLVNPISDKVVPTPLDRVAQELPPPLAPPPPPQRERGSLKDQPVSGQSGFIFK